TNKLIITSVNTAHSGHYTCRASYTHLGKQYRVTRAIKLITLDKCEEHEEKITLVSSAHEIDVRSCPLITSVRREPITWYKNDSMTPVSTERASRIHQHEDKLWFVPAEVGDSGAYYCSVRNSTYCLKIKIVAEFVQHEPNMCYNERTVFTQRLLTAGDGQLVCPYLDFLKDENNELPQVQWYKQIKQFALIDNRMNPQKKSRNTKPEIVSPANETMEVVLGKVENPLNRRRSTVLARLNISKVESKFFLHPFTCLAKNTEGLSTAYIQLIHPESQSHDVDTLVLKILPEVLEKQCGYKLFIFGRDEFPGQAVVNVIDENIRLCRRLIIVIDPDELSFDLLKNLSEEQIAVYSALIQDGIKVILIELGKVNDYTALPESIQYIKQKHGAVRWSGDFTEQSQCAKTQFWKKKPTVGIFVMLTLVITCSLCIYKVFKVDIVLWYRDSFYDFLPKKDGKTYDAYILCPKTPGEGPTCNSDIFVFKVMPEVLENQCGYKLFICGRDDYVGESIVEVVNENVKKSRRLIIILVPETSGFSWLGNSSEEQVAMYNALIQEGIKVVLLELEKIPDYEKMPESIKFIKQKQGVIRWSGDFREGSQSMNSRFWKKVRYHMPVQRQRPLSKHQLLSPATLLDSKEKRPMEVHVPLG
ncbi:IL1R1, partial [Cervus elaphus hippelaphus]